ncbi:hypothetical protein ACFU3O_36765 [Streptomyces antibioticus]|uniref:hypothetical protein n=1 Tax=Streptomyces antibioticus TaxID=1890 RepID=UPI0036C93060
MPDTPDFPPPLSHDEISARQPLPGTRLLAYRLPACGIAGPCIHMNSADVHVTYAQTVGRAGRFPAQGLSYGLRTVGGRDVDRWLRGSLNFWLSSEARRTADGVIRYRQTPRHSVVTFVPDKASGVLINRPNEQVTAGAYRVTGPTGIPQLWRGRAVRDAIAKCLQKPPVGWPEGWAHLMPDTTVVFAPGGFPWSAATVYTAEAAGEPAGRPDPSLATTPLPSG